MSNLLRESDIADLMSYRQSVQTRGRNRYSGTLRLDDCMPVLVNGSALEDELPAPGLSTWLRQFITKTEAPLVWHEIDVARGEAVRACVHRIIDRNRTRQSSHILLAGTPLDSTLTFVALETLAAGFRVVLLIDLIGTAQKDRASIYWHRLFQAGAIPSTFGQVLQEWHYSASDPRTTTALGELIDDYEKVRPIVPCDQGLLKR